MSHIINQTTTTRTRKDKSTCDESTLENDLTMFAGFNPSSSLAATCNMIRNRNSFAFCYFTFAVIAILAILAAIQARMGKRQAKVDADPLKSRSQRRGSVCSAPAETYILGGAQTHKAAAVGRHLCSVLATQHCHLTDGSTTSRHRLC